MQSKSKVASIIIINFGHDPRQSIRGCLIWPIIARPSNILSQAIRFTFTSPKLRLHPTEPSENHQLRIINIFARILRSSVQPLRVNGRSDPINHISGPFADSSSGDPKVTVRRLFLQVQQKCPIKNLKLPSTW